MFIVTLRVVTKGNKTKQNKKNLMSMNRETVE